MNRWTKALLVALRIAIGWHFLYEGVWKIRSDTGATAYATSWYPLRAGMSRLHDPDAWYDELVKTFKGRNQALTEDQKARLAELRDRIKGGLVQPGDFDWIYLRDAVLQIAPPPEAERFTALPFLQSSAGPFRRVFRGMVPDIDGLDRLAAGGVTAALDRRAAQIAAHYGFDAGQSARLLQARDGIKAEFLATWGEPAIQDRLADYRLMRARVAAASGQGAPFLRERLSEDRGKLDRIAGELLSLAAEPLDELAVQAQGIATVGQMTAGPVPRVAAPCDTIDRVIEYALTAIGVCLLLGLCTPFAAAAAAMQLAMFYLASPPWPGLPAAAVGGHYLYVDRNLVEMIAAGLIAVTGSGRWAGLDFYLTRRRAAAPAVTEGVRSFV